MPATEQWHTANARAASQLQGTIDQKAVLPGVPDNEECLRDPLGTRDSACRLRRSARVLSRTSSTMGMREVEAGVERIHRKPLLVLWGSAC